MLEQAYKRYEYIRKAQESDPEYLALRQRFLDQEPEFRAVMQVLPSGQREVINEYLGILAELEERAMELACFAP